MIMVGSLGWYRGDVIFLLELVLFPVLFYPSLLGLLFHIVLVTFDEFEVPGLIVSNV